MARMEHTTNHYVELALKRLLPHHQVEAERTTKHGDQRKRIDIDIQYGETRIVLEAKRGNKAWAARDAADRFAELNPKPAVVGALSYSAEFSDENAAEAIRAGAEFDFAFANSAAPESWNGAWRTGTIYDLAQAIRNPGDMGVGVQDKAAEAVQIIRNNLSEMVDHFKAERGSQRGVAEVLKVESNEDTLRVGGLIVINALMFYSALRSQEEILDKNGKQISFPTASGALPIEICAAWDKVRKRVNYGAILELAGALIRGGEMTAKMIELLQGCAQTALPMAQSGVDILGRIFHEVLDSAKTKAAFYTSIPGAVMMSELALDPESWENVDWANPKSVGNLCVCDPSCGSGTLASTLAWKIRDNHLRAALSQQGWEKRDGDDLRELQRLLVEEVMWGYDISHAAVHMTATTLGLISPKVDFRHSRIFAVRIGPTPYSKPRLGSLNYLDEKFSEKEFTAVSAASGSHAVGKDAPVTPPPAMDLCAMNPPFVSGRKGRKDQKGKKSKKSGKMFDFITPESARIATVDAFKEMGEEHGFHTGRGQGPPFAIMGARKVKPGGRWAVILPSNLAMGFDVAWEESRQIIEEGFDLETFIVSKEPKFPGFSDSANFSECMAIARKLKANEKPRDKPALFVSLHRNPQKREEALAVSRAIREAAKGGESYGDIVVDEATMGTYARLPYRGRPAWFGGNFADLHLALTANQFADIGSLKPYAEGKIPTRPLGEMVEKYGSNDLHRAKNKWGSPPSLTRSAYPCYWPSMLKKLRNIGHKDNSEILEEPHCWVTPKPNKSHLADKFYSAAGPLVVSDSFRIQTSRRFASLMTEPVQSSCGIPIRLHNSAENRYKALALWFASSPGIFMMARGVGVTSEAKVKVSHGHMAQMIVPDLDAIGEDCVDALAKCFDNFVLSGKKLGQIQHIAEDSVRAELDGQVARILGIGNLEGDLSLLREALGREPIITNRLFGA